MQAQLINVEEAVAGVELVASLEGFEGHALTKGMEIMARGLIDLQHEAGQLSSRQRSAYLSRLDALHAQPEQRIH